MHETMCIAIKKKVKIPKRINGFLDGIFTRVNAEEGTLFVCKQMSRVPPSEWMKVLSWVMLISSDDKYCVGTGLIGGSIQHAFLGSWIDNPWNISAVEKKGKKIIRWKRYRQLKS
jgi:hypothetical protein